jgi:uncharacterized protein (DUF2141 family)
LSASIVDLEIYLMRPLLFFVLGLIFTSELTLAGQLNISIDGLKPVKSQIHIAIFDSKETFLSSVRFRAFVLPVDENFSSMQINDLPKGLYAISVYQDLNGNNELDRGIFGQPLEPYGFSGRDHPKFRAPDFEQCAFNYRGADDIIINLKKN